MRWQRTRVEPAPARHDHVLLAVELVGDRTVADATDRGVPQRGAIARAEREDTVRGIAGKSQAGLGRQHSGAAFAADLVLPTHRARLIVESAEHSLGVDAVV